MSKVYDFKSGIYLTNQDFHEIKEIFHTPLTGSYNWDYTAADDKINRLYQLAKKRQWDVEIDLDWSQKWDKDKAKLEDYSLSHQSYLGYEPYLALSDEEKLNLQHKLAAWSLSQFLHGEQGALLVASQLCSCAPTYNAKLYAATQTYDEARHVEAFNKYIQTRHKEMYPITPDLKKLLDKILTDER
ncbi:MAG TPA: ferritin, partial [Gammaproteobacteria bacterium]|nr:ferritin [Gammaproteobacteria bacterium]